MSEFTNVTLVYGFFNKYVISEVKMNMDYIKMYYKDNFMLYNNILITKFLDLIENYEYNDITDARIKLTLVSIGKSDDEVIKISNAIQYYQGYDQSQASSLIEAVRNICSTAWINRCQKKYSDEPEKYISELKKYSYKSNYSDKLVAKNISKLDLTDLVARYRGDGYSSRYPFINKAFTCNGYIPGQIVLVAGAPSCFTGDTEVLVKNKVTEQINKIEFSKLIDSYSDYQVLTFDPEFNNFIWGDIVDAFNSGESDNLIEIEFGDGTKITCTEDHLFLTEEGYIKAIDLTEDSKLISYE